MKPLLGTAATQSAIHVWLLILRILLTGFMLTHGIPKLTKVLNGTMTFGDPLGIGSGPSLVLAMLAEVGCALLVLIGFQTRLAVLPIIITMLVAAFLANAGKPFGDRELPLLYILLYTTLFFTGPGKYSIDGRERNSAWPRRPGTFGR
ncbi:DoxX family protein [Nibrella saemangeumensis]|uniref:DoxX family protein n=1 Tax=Nibrella saemangeumensis TaxID=1084526 RepID=A0ABP8MA86_9BACT